jgi:hypothetical protein
MPLLDDDDEKPLLDDEDSKNVVITLPGLWDFLHTDKTDATTFRSRNQEILSLLHTTAPSRWSRFLTGESFSAARYQMLQYAIRNRLGDVINVLQKVRRIATHEIHHR